MEFRHLRAFRELAQVRHFRAAASKLGLTQPAVSQIISELEKEVGVPLFDRTEEGLRLSEAGERFQTYATQCLAAADNALQTGDVLREFQEGRLRCGFTHSHRALAEEAVKRLLSTHRNLRVRAEEAEASVLEQLLRDGKLDVAVAFRREGLETPGIVAEKGIPVPLRLLVAEGHPLAKSGTVHLRELRETKFALPRSRLRIREAVDALFAAHKLPLPPLVFETNIMPMLFTYLRDHDDVASIAPMPKEEPGIVTCAIEPGDGLMSALLWPTERSERKGKDTSAKPEPKPITTPAAEAFAHELRALRKEERHKDELRTLPPPPPGKPAKKPRKR